ncbi:MAG TPA: hypothetical protein VN370_00265 [Desulfitobacteriaceae bacterium]|nr:hypothetical protein [Desulfitobacteriaceae bacterium]
MANIIKAYCVECGESAEFLFDGQDWICRNCGSFNSQGDPGDSVILDSYEEQ